MKLAELPRRLIPRPRWYNVLLRVAAVLTLVALALMVWSVLQPTPMPVLVAMMVGQVFGTIAFACYGLVVIADLRRTYRRRQAGEPEESGAVPVLRDEPAGTEGATPGQGSSP